MADNPALKFLLATCLCQSSTKQFQLTMTKQPASCELQFLLNFYCIFPSVVLKYFILAPLPVYMSSCHLPLFPPDTNCQSPSSPVPKHKSNYHCPLSPNFLYFQSIQICVQFPTSAVLSKPTTQAVLSNEPSLSTFAIPEITPVFHSFHVPRGYNNSYLSVLHAALYPSFFPSVLMLQLPQEEVSGALPRAPSQ